MNGYELATKWYKETEGVMPNISTFFTTKGLVANTVRSLITDKIVLDALDTVLAYGRGECSKEELKTAYYAVCEIRSNANDAVKNAYNETREIYDSVESEYYAISAVNYAAHAIYDDCDGKQFLIDVCLSANLAFLSHAGKDAQNANKIETAKIIKENLL